MLVIRHVDQAEPGPFPLIAGVRAAGGITSKPVVATSDRPLFLWLHELPAGAELSLDKPPFGHIFYLFSGDVEVGDKPLKEGGVILAEHQCQTNVRAGARGATLLHFHRPNEYSRAPGRAGGHVHLSGPNGNLRTGDLPDSSIQDAQDYSGLLWADLDCPTCELWLHRSDTHGPRDQKGSLHTHSADEIIFMLRGEMFIGNRTLLPGNAIAIDGATRYRVGSGQQGFSFLNCRVEHSTLVMMEDGDHAPRDERELWLGAALVV